MKSILSLILLSLFWFSGVTSAAQITGTIELENGEIAQSGPIEFEVNFCATDLTEIIYCVGESVEIAENANGVDYALTYPDEPENVHYEYSAILNCTSNCGVYQTNPITHLWQYFSQVPEESIDGPIDFTVQKEILIEGLLTLPNSELADGDLVADIEVCSYSIEFALLGCTEESLTISDGEHSQSFNLQAIPTGLEHQGYFQISYECKQNCLPYVTSEYFLHGDLVTSSTSRRDIQASILNTPIELPLRRGQPVLGTVSLPNNEVALEDMGHNITLCSRRNSYSSLWCATEKVIIAAGSNSASYAISVESSNEVESYYLRQTCTSNCENYIRNSQYIDQDGTFAYEFATIDAASMPTQVDFELQLGTIFTGELRLPNSESASEDIVSLVSICSYNPLKSLRGCDYRSVTIPEGENSIPYTLSVRPATQDGFYRLSTRCQSGCGLFLRGTRYLGPDLTFDFEYNSYVATASMPLQTNIDLDHGYVLSGTITLPSGDVAEQSLLNTLNLCSYSQEGFQLGCSYQSVESKIDPGESSFDYAISVRTAPPEGYYSFSTVCLDPCDPYVNSERYLQTDLSMGYEFTRIDADSFPTSADFSLEPGRVVTGKIRLPNGELAAEKISIQVSFCSFDGFGVSLGCVPNYGQDIEIPEGQNFGTYSRTARPAPLDGHYRLSVRCIDNCGTYVDVTQYLSEELSPNYEDSRIPQSVLPDEVDFTLAEGKILRGIIRLPDGEIATDQTVSSYVQLCSYSSEERRLDCDSQRVEIGTGSNSGDFSISVLSAPNDGYYEFQTGCSGSCEGFLPNTRYLNTDQTLGFNRERVSWTALPAEIEFEMTRGFQVSGQISIEGGEIVENDTGSRLTLCSYTAEGQPITCTSSYSNVITSGNASTPYQISIIPAPEGGSYSLRVSCQTNCGLIQREDRFVQSDGSLDYFETQLSSEFFNKDVNLFLTKGRVVTGTISLPDESLASQDLYNSISFCSYSETGSYLDCASASVVLNAGENSATFAVSIRPAEGGTYRLQSSCSSDCGRYISEPQYLQSDGSFDLTSNNVTSEDLPESVQIVLPEGFGINGNVILSEGAPSGTLYGSLEICRYGSNKEYLGCDWQSVTFSDGRTSRSYELYTSPVPDGGFYKIRSYCSSNCGVYLADSQYLQPDLSFDFEEAYLPADFSAPENLDILLPVGRILSLKVTEPESLTTSQSVTVSYTFCSYDEFGNTIDCQNSNSYGVLGAESEIDILTSIKPAPDNGFYRLSIRCDSSSCEVFDKTTRYLQPDLSVSYTNTLVPAAQMPGSLTVELILAKHLELTLLLPENELAADQIRNYVAFCSYGSDQQLLACSSSYSNYISTGSNKLTKDLFVRPAPEDGFYSIRTNCSGNCNGYKTDPQHLQADLSFGDESALVPASSLPESASVELKKINDNTGLTIDITVRMRSLVVTC